MIFLKLIYNIYQQEILDIKSNLTIDTMTLVADREGFSLLPKILRNTVVLRSEGSYPETLVAKRK